MSPCGADLNCVECDVKPCSANQPGAGLYAILWEDLGNSFFVLSFLACVFPVLFVVRDVSLFQFLTVETVSI